MPDTKRSLPDLQLLLADNTSGFVDPQDVRDLLVSVYPVVLPLPQGRLTTESGVAVSTSDRTAQSTLYYTPYTGNGIWLYDGTIWQPYAFTERSLALSGLTANRNYDVFIYDNAGTLTLELSAAWTNDTTRAEALTTQDGILVKSGSTTRRWLGTIRTTGTTTVEDSATKRFVWNAYNRTRRTVQKTDTTASYTYSTATLRQTRADASNQIEVVCGMAGVASIDLRVWAIVSSSVSGDAVVCVGVDSTSTRHSSNFGGQAQGGVTAFFPQSSFFDVVELGYHYYAWLERGHGSGTQTWYGEASPFRKPGINGAVEC